MKRLLLPTLFFIAVAASAQRMNTVADTVAPVFRNLAEMKSAPVAALDTAKVYIRNNSGNFVQYKWNPAATSKDDSVTVIQRTGAERGRFELYFEHYIDAAWFGAVANDGKDDSWSIQKAINFALNSAKNPVVQLSGGNYEVNNVVIGKKNGSEYDFITLTLRGNTNFVAATTQFTCTNKKAFCLNIQLGRSIVIENIRFNGSATPIRGLRQMVEATEATYTTGVIANQYSQHNAINIDAFHSTVPWNSRYPDLNTSWYSNNGRAGTSMVSIRNCSFLNFVNAVIESPAGIMQNGDNIVVSDCYFEGNKNCFSSGQTQSRGNKLIGCYLLFNQTIVNGQDYGSNQGTAADIINCNIAGGTKYLYQVNGGFSGVNIVNTYAESLYSLGISGDMPVTFTNSQMTFARDDVDEMFISPVIAQGRQVTFVGGSIEYFDNVFATPFVFNVAGALSFNGTLIRGGVPLNSYYNTGKVKFNSATITTADGSGRLDETAQTPLEDISLVVNKHIIPGMNYKLRQGIHAEAVNDKIETTIFESARIRVNPKNHTAYFISAKPGRYKKYDALADLGPDIKNPNPNDRYAGTQGSIGVVSDVAGDTVKLRYVPYGIADNSTHSVHLVRIPKFLPRIIGDVQAGSDVIRNVQVYGGTLYVGSRVKGAGIPDGAHITGVSAGTLKISLPATATVNNNPVYDAKVLFTATSYATVYPLASMPIIYPGDYIDAEFSNTGSASDSIARWYCVKAGVAGGSPAPVWRGLRFNDGSGSGAATGVTSGTYTPVLNTGANVNRAGVSVCQYMRVGNVVIVSGELQIDAKGPGAIEIGMSLPVAPGFTALGDAAGTAANGAGGMLRLSADPAANRVKVSGVAGSKGTVGYSFMVSYKLQ